QKLQTPGGAPVRAFRGGHVLFVSRPGGWAAHGTPSRDRTWKPPGGAAEVSRRAVADAQAQCGPGDPRRAELWSHFPAVARVLGSLGSFMGTTPSKALLTVQRTGRPSQTRTVRSGPPAEARKPPSGLNATPRTRSACPFRLASS